MTRLAIAAVALCLKVLSAEGVDAEDAVDIAAGGSSSVVVLTDANFDEQVQGGKEVPWFLEFYAPWCGHCKSLAPEWEKLPGLLGAKARVGKVDATVEKRLAKDFEIESFPKLKLISKGQMYSYDGPRVADAMADWAGGEFASDSSEKFPKQKSLFADIKKEMKRFGTTVDQVHSFMPLLLPLVLCLGIFVGFCFASLLCGSGKQRVPKELDETFSVNMVRDEKGVAGLGIDMVTLRIQTVDGERENLKHVQVGDTIIAVNKESVMDAHGYRWAAHGEKEFTLTLGRSSKASAKVANGEGKKEQ